jgi:hypothetical protein
MFGFILHQKVHYLSQLNTLKCFYDGVYMSINLVCIEPTRPHVSIKAYK